MKNRKLLLSIVTVTTVIVLAAVLWFLLSSRRASNRAALPGDDHQSSENINYKAPTQEQIDAGASAKKDTIDADQSKSSRPTGPVSITTTATEVTESVVRLRFMIEGVHTGTCSIVLNGPDNRIVQKSANTQPLASTTTCQGFDILTSDLSPGKWSFVVTGKFADGLSGQTSGDFSL